LVLTLISVLVGLALAVLYHLLSMRFQRWIGRFAPSTVVAITVVGFLARLTLIAVILVVLGLFSPFNIIALSLAFLAGFTVLNVVSIYLLFVKRRSAPPSAGVTGAR